MYLLWRDSSRLKTATNHFNPINEKRQVGCYSQSKALATQAVLDACRTRGLKACVVHPSGILGPKDYAISETTGTVIKIMNGKMPIGMGVQPYAVYRAQLCKGNLKCYASASK